MTKSMIFFTRFISFYCKKKGDRIQAIGRLAQWQSTSFTLKGLKVQILQRPLVVYETTITFIKKAF